MTCSAPLGYLHDTDRLRALGDDETTEIDGTRWRLCANSRWGCNWLLPDGEASAWCTACRLVRDRPEADDTIGLEQLALASYAERRLLFQLAEHQLPVTPWWERAGGLAFRLLSSASGRERVTIGHANGVVTIDVNEVGDAYRESLRVRLGEPYRTMLGHFRHEIGHYYWQVLVPDDALLLERFRRLFGDERASYREALQRHYKLGAPRSWNESYISEYATMHPWEDFAETWAHYLHITDALQTAASFGMRLEGLRGEKLAPQIRETLTTAPDLSMTGYHEQSMDTILDIWHPLSIAFNQINRSMGKDDLYPFAIPVPVREKLAFVHEIVGGAAGTPPPVSSNPGSLTPDGG